MTEREQFKQKFREQAWGMDVNEDVAYEVWQAARAQRAPTTQGAKSKVEQMGGKVVGVLVENEAGALAAVHDLGRVTWLDDCAHQAGSVEAVGKVRESESTGDWAGSHLSVEWLAKHNVKDGDLLYTHPQPAQQGSVPAADIEKIREAANELADYDIGTEDLVPELFAVADRLEALTQPEVRQERVPEGWKLLPVHATADMVRRGKRAHGEEFLFHEDPESNIQGIWKAMLAIAPELPTTPQPEGDGWIKCSERLPGVRSIERKKPNGILTLHENGRITQFREVTESLREYMAKGPRQPMKFEVSAPPAIVAWIDLDEIPTGLKRPNPPAEQEDKGDDH